MFNEIAQRIAKTNDQRIKMSLVLFNIMKNTSGQACLQLRSAVAASVIEMLDTSMIAEDMDLIKLLNEAVDVVCSDVKAEYGITDFRSTLNGMIKQTHEQIERIEKGEEILKSLNLDNINLN
jgi:succinylarginine dihydrolase